jgi:hypothetical protein
LFPFTNAVFHEEYGVFYVKEKLPWKMAGEKYP